MRRKIMERLKKWRNAKNRLPLLLYGARQVGKTYILREFGRSCFENTVYVNFEEDKALAGYLEVKLTPAYIIKVIEEQYGVKIYPQKTLIIFDEIQEEGLRNIIAKAMSLNPENRYQTAAEMLEALKVIDK